MSIFPTKILLATDGSKEAQLAATTAADLAKRTGSELHVLHVGAGHPSYEAPGVSGVLSGITEEVLDEQRQEAQRVLDEQVRRLEDSGTTVKEAHLSIDERPDRTIVHLSEDIGAGLIAMGSRGRGGIRRALMGSISDAVVHHAHCPVMVVRE
jgi:nucleotide-binding universal stress UspA family protein